MDLAPTTAAGRPRGAVARATLLVALSAAGFGSNSILTILATREGVPLLSVLFWRYALALPPLIVLAGGFRALSLPRRRALPLVVVGGGGQGLVSLLALASLAWIPAATLGFLFYTYPAWVTLVAAVRRTEPIGPRRGLAVALALGGIALMAGMPGTAGLHPAGVALALGAAILYGLYLPVVGRLQHGVPPTVAAVSIAAGAGALLGLAALGAGRFTAALPLPAWGAVAGLALVSTVLAFLFFLRGLAILGPVRTAIVSTVEPFWIALLGLAVLGQPLTAATLAGGALVAAAVVLLQLPARR